jgi:hypothetical protein
MAQTRRKFDHDIREGAVRPVRKTGKPVGQVSGHQRGHARELGNADEGRRSEGNGALSEDG